MSRYRLVLNKILTGLFLFVLLSATTNILAQNGEALFKANCASCHKPDQDFTGPALKGARDREPNKDWVYKWVHNTTSMVESDQYAKALKAKFGSVMTPQSLKDEEITAILDFADKYDPNAGKKDDNIKSSGGGDDNSLIFGILTLVLALIAFILLQVNRNLKNLTDQKEGIVRSEPIPFYKTKSYLMAGVLALFALGGYFTINGAIGLGRMKNYQPVQPIYYSHKVHAGTNQISCLYCHGGAQDSRHANIPSVNVCMNCHKGINKYEGDKIVREDGTEVNGTAEIQKLYSYAGFNPTTKTYNPDTNGDGIPDGAHPIEWIQIHNLPAHVYFNHSQHVKVGKQQCQTCHGNIQEMPEVFQFAELSMGWCINCHRETKVDFYNKDENTGNKFYSIYEKFHQDLKNGKMDSVTVEKIGGTECQKCHY